ncbi:hypothetical protein CFOL_v3_09403, partial [Cephalotus follicularis]
EIDFQNLPCDPRMRKSISEYHPNARDKIRRHYLLNWPYQPRDHNFSQTKIGKFSRQFNYSWFSKYPNWLDYSIEKDVFCLHSSNSFLQVKEICNLAQKMVETWKDLIYPLVYLLVKLTLILFIATTTVKRTFSAMNIVKNIFRNRIGDSWMNDCLVTYIEKTCI